MFTLPLKLPTLWQTSALLFKQEILRKISLTFFHNFSFFILTFFFIKSFSLKVDWRVSSSGRLNYDLVTVLNCTMAEFNVQIARVLSEGHVTV